MAGTIVHRVITTRSVPCRCPVCAGCGSVEHNFYTQMTYGTNANRIQCRTCNGSGVVWGTETTTNG